MEWGNSEGSYVRVLDSDFRDCFIECGLHQWVDSGTFVRSNNVLDLVLTSSEDRVYGVEVLDPLPGCDHSPVVCNLAFQFGEFW